MNYSQVIITGASSGFGKAFAEALAPFCRTLVLVARREAQLQQLARELSSAYSTLQVRVCPCDLSDAAARAALTSKLISCTTGSTLLINNAGVGDYGDFATSSAARNAAIIQVNMAAVVELTHALLPAMKAQGGAIINMASLAADLPIPDFAMYAASKAFVASFSEALRLELQEDNIPVLTVCPGPAHTGFGDVALRGGRSDGKSAFHAWFYTPVEAIVEGSLQALRLGIPRYYPSLRIKLAGFLLRNTPFLILRALLSLRPRKTKPQV